MDSECPRLQQSPETPREDPLALCGRCSELSHRPSAEAVTCPHCKAALRIVGNPSVVICGSCSQRIQLESRPTPILIKGAEDEPAPDEPKDMTKSLGAGAPTGEEKELANVRAQFEGRYEVLERLGYGGMGVIYKAHQKQPSRVVVLKVLRAGRFASQRHRRRFEREAQAVARLRHPGIVSVFECGEVEGHPYLTMEYVDGHTLRDYVQRHRSNKKQICQLMHKVCRAVAYAHQRGVIHRDIKPTNIVVDTKGSPRVLDFGLARLSPNSEEEQISAMTETGEVMGTPAYMSPEQTIGRPEEVDVRTDVYSIGVMLFELLTGELPYQLDRARPLEALRKVRDFLPPRPSSLNPRVDRDLEAIVLKCLEKNKEQRYQGAPELAEDISRYLRGDLVQARPATTFYQLRKMLWRHRRLFVPAVAAAVATVVVTGVFVGQLAASQRKAKKSAREARVAEKKALEQQDRLVHFITELKSVETRVYDLLAAQKWREAHRIAQFAQEALPNEAGLAGLTRKVENYVTTQVSVAAREIESLIKEQRFKAARSRLSALEACVAEVPCPEAGSAVQKIAEGFPEACWQSVREAIKKDEVRLTALAEFLACGADRERRAEVASLLTRRLEGIMFEQWPFDGQEAVGRREATATTLGVPVERILSLAKDVQVRLVLIPAGEFVMGSIREQQSPEGNENPPHRVRISRPFYMSATEITRRQYAAVMGEGDKGQDEAGGELAPYLAPEVAASRVSWNDAREFCARLARATEMPVRLPTEAEWEYACRSGARTRFYYGDDPTHSALGEYAWFEGNAEGKPHEVARKKPNVWGLFDMHGNVMEWCLDWYDSTYYYRSAMLNPPGPPQAKYKTLRGGSWGSSAEDARSSRRLAGDPAERRIIDGMRICVDVLSVPRFQNLDRQHVTRQSRTAQQPR